MPISSTQLNVVAVPSTATGTTNIEVSANLTGLESGKEYFYYIRVESSGGAMLGENFYFTTPDKVMDSDENMYNTLIIGTQTWFQENLKTTKYRDGTNIDFITNNAEWSNNTSGAYCDNSNNPNNSETYGRLYSSYAARNGHNLCPTGWRVSTDEDWKTLTDFLGGEDIAGAKLKEAGTSHWLLGNIYATNESGFTALPGGGRSNDGSFDDVGLTGYWWSHPPNDSNGIHYMVTGNSKVVKGTVVPNSGFSVRCIKGEGLVLPIAETKSVSVKGTEYAICEGNITSDGGYTGSGERGFCWNTVTGPTVLNSLIASGSGTGPFRARITQLSPNTTYYVRAYATNPMGISYGNEISFTTPATVSYDNFIYNTLVLGSQTWMQENLRTTKFADGTPIPDGMGKGDYSHEAAPIYYFSYGDNTANDIEFGKYYTWYTSIDNHKLCPTGWRVPDQNDWQNLEDYLVNNNFGYGGSSHVGKATASASGWIIDLTPGNVGNDQSTNNTSGFSGSPGGNRNFLVSNNGTYYGRGIYGRYQSVNEYDNYNAIIGKLDASDDDLNIAADSKKHGFNVRCIKGEGAQLSYMPTLTTKLPTNITASSITTGGIVVTDGNASVTERGVCWNTSGNPTVVDNYLTSGSGLGEFTVNITSGLNSGKRYYARAYAVNSDNKVGYGYEISFTTGGTGVLTDAEGNNYETVTIGAQTWMAENLKVTHLNDATAIQHLSDYTQWGNSTTPGYCWILNNPDLFKDIYGALYNWYTVNTGKLCPNGWHVPSTDDWNKLFISQGGISTAGEALKDAGTAHWYSPNTGNNSSGFSGLPGGYRMGFDEKGEQTGFFDRTFQDGSWWTSSQDPSVPGDPWAWSITLKNSQE